MPAEASFQTGEIYLVKFHPSDGAELRKFRPAVIMSDKVSNIDSRFALIAPFTTSTHNYNPDAELLIKKAEGLNKPSVLLCWYLWTIDTTRLLEKIGQLSKADIQKMLKMTQNLLLPSADASNPPTI
jgi:mRNA interferase MazF